MTNKHITHVGYDQEEAYFRQKDAQLLALRRAKLDAHRRHFDVDTLKCTRCGSEMQEVAVEQVKVDRCTECGGVYLDTGELEILTHVRSGGFFKRLFGT